MVTIIFNQQKKIYCITWQFLRYRVFNHRQIQSKAFFRREIIGFHWTLWSHLNLHELHFHLVKQSQPCLNNENFLFFNENRVFLCFSAIFQKLRHWVCWDLFGRPKNENNKLGQRNIPKKLWKNFCKKNWFFVKKSLSIKFSNFLLNS